MYHELVQHVGDLQQDVEVFDCVWVFAKGMFQVVAAVLLCMESHIFNEPSQSSSMIGQFFYRKGIDVEICDPNEVPFFVGCEFDLLKDVEGVPPIGQIIDPGKDFPVAFFPFLFLLSPFSRRLDSSST